MRQLFKVFFEANSQVEVDETGAIHLPTATVRDLLSKGRPVNRRFSDIARLAEVLDLSSDGDESPAGGAPAPTEQTDPLIDTVAGKLIRDKSQGEPGQPGKPDQSNQPEQPSDPSDSEESGEPGDPGEGDPSGEPGDPSGDPSNGEQGSNGQPGEVSNDDIANKSDNTNSVTLKANGDGTFTDENGNTLTSDQVRDLQKSGVEVKTDGTLQKNPNKKPEGEMITAEEVRQKKGIAPSDGSTDEKEPSKDPTKETGNDLKNQLDKTNTVYDSEEGRKKMAEQIEKAREHIIADEEMTDDFWKQRIKDVEVSTTGGASGDGEGTKETLVDKMIKRTTMTIDWRGALKRLFTKPSNKVTDWKRPSRRSYATRTYMPRTVQNADDLETIIIAIDQSGSLMTGDAFSKFVNEIISLFKTTKNATGYVLPYNTIVTSAIKVTSANFNNLLTLLPTGGNNDMDAVPAYVTKHMPKIKPKAVIFFTDGYEDRPNLPIRINGQKVEYIFFLVPGGRRETVEGFGKIYPIVG